MRKRLIFLVGALLLMASPIDSYAQDTCYSVIQGVVSDPSGAPLPDVAVEAIWGVRYDTTDSQGRYALDFAEESQYMLSFQKDGYAFYATGWITLSCDDTVEVNVTLWPSCDYVVGDINGNGHANGIDVTFAIYFFKGGNAPLVDCGSPVGPCLQASPFYAAGDVNGNCQFNGVDIAWFIYYISWRGPGLRHCPSCPPDNND
jgi:hypothetical protein